MIELKPFTIEVATLRSSPIRDGVEYHFMVRIKNCPWLSTDEPWVEQHMVIGDRGNLPTHAYV